jgi:hypothetical protein
VLFSPIGNYRVIYKYGEQHLPKVLKFVNSASRDGERFVAEDGQAMPREPFIWTLRNYSIVE